MQAGAARSDIVFVRRHAKMPLHASEGSAPSSGLLRLLRAALGGSGGLKAPLGTACRVLEFAVSFVADSTAFV